MSKTRVPAIPAPTDANLREVARAVKGVLDVREGLIGDPLDANVTFRELVDGGVIQVTSAGNRITGVVSTGGSGSSSGYDPTADLTPPPAPTGFTATGLFASVQLQWDTPPETYANHAYTEVWRSDANVIGNAVMIGTSDGQLYVDYLGNNVTRFYWVRFISQANVKGPYNATPGTQATTAQNPGLLLNSLTTAITSSQLAASLGDRINLIDGADTLSGTVNARIKTSQDAVTSLVTVPAYSNTKTYAAGELVTYNNNLYKALGATTGNLPTDTTKWKLVGQYSSLANSFAAVFTDYLTTADTNSAISSATNGLVSTTSLNTTLGNYVTTSTLTNDYYTKTATDSAISTATTNLVSQTSLTNTLNSYVTSATLTSNYYTKTATDSAISSATTNLVSQTSLNTTLSSYATTATLTSSYYTKTDTDSAISTASQTLVARYGELDAAVSWNFTGGVEGFTASGATLSSQGQFVRLTSTGSDPVLVSPAVSLNGATHTLIRARVRRVAGTGWQGDAYYTTSGHGVSNSFRSNIANTTALNEWRLLEWDMANLTAGGSDWTSNTILSIRLDLGATAADVFDIDWVAIGRLGVGAYSSAIQTLATTTAGPDGATAQYTVKIDQGGHVTGYGLSSTANNATPYSEFGVRADRFWVAPPTFVNATAPTTGLYKGYAWRDTGVNPAVTRYWNGTAWTTTPQNLPFVVVAGPTETINGVTVNPGVYIDTALIADATITNTKIGNAAIDDAKIANLSAAKITAGTLDVARLGANSITADRIRVTSKGGLTIISEDPMFGDSTLWTTTASISFLTGDTTTGGKGGTYVASSVGTDRQVTSARRFEIDPTKIYRLSANLYRATGSDRNIYLFLQFYNGAGTYLGNAGWGGAKSGYTFGGLPTPVGEWVRCGNSFGAGTARTIPATARFCEIGVWFNYSGNGTTTAEQRCQDLRLDEYIDAGQLIVDGSVTATQINSNGLSIRDTAGNVILSAGASVAASNFLGNVTGSVSGSPANTVATGAADGTSALNAVNNATTGLATKLSSNARTALTGSGGVAVGNLQWNSSGVRTSGQGIGLTSNGLAAYNSSGNATFSILASDGSATFAGALSAATGSFSGAVYGGSYSSSYAWPSAGTPTTPNNGFHLSSGGLLLGNYNTLFGTAPNQYRRYFQIEANGDVFAPGFTIINGSATFSGSLSANTVNTTNIVGAAISSGYSTSGSSSATSISVTVVVPTNTSAVIILGYTGEPFISSSGSGKDAYNFTALPAGTVKAQRTHDADGNAVSESVQTVTTQTQHVITSINGPTPGTYTVTLDRNVASGTFNLAVVVNKR